MGLLTDLLGDGDSATSRVWVPANRFSLGGAGSPAMHSDVPPSWLFDSASLEQIGAIVELPESWATYDVAFYWANHAASSGNVRWSYRRDPELTDGVAVASPTTSDGTFAAPTTAAVLEISTLATGVAAATLFPVGVRRSGADAADTLANDARFYGLLFTRAS